MQNRREHYRHAFPSNHRLRAWLAKQSGEDGVSGEIVNLSISGMCIKLDSTAATVEGHYFVRFELNEVNEALQVRAETVHARQDHDRCLGLRFLFPIHVPTRENLERKISKYLLDVQRYERRLMKDSKTLQR